jgi:hypothetical protein
MGANASVTFNPATNTLSYNSAETLNPNQALTFTANVDGNNPNYTITASATLNITVHDGLEANARAIPVTQENITRPSTGFINYASNDSGLERNYILTENITLTGTNNWTPVGTSSTPFTGTFNGNSKTITGLNMSGLGGSVGGGMFGALDQEGIIRDLSLYSVNISGIDYIGGIAGYNYLGIIENCTVTGTITGTSDYVGGIVGNNSGTIEKCFSEGNIIGSSYVGGIVGNNDNGTIEDNASTGNITGTDNYVGGIAGASMGTIRRCYATGSISGNDSVGGIVGRHDGGAVDNCVALNTGVTSNPGGQTGRIVGLQTSGAGAVELANNYASVKILIDGASVIGGYQNNKNGSDITESNYEHIWMPLGFTGTWWDTIPGGLPDLSQYLASASSAMFKFDECF